VPDLIFEHAPPTQHLHTRSGFVIRTNISSGVRDLWLRVVLGQSEYDYKSVKNGNTQIFVECENFFVNRNI